MSELMKGISIRPALIASAIAALALVVPSGAGAAVTCGKTVTKDLKLKADLDCSTSGSNGLEIGRPNITIDLNGHSIIGAGGLDGYEGIENDGWNKVTITNGKIKNFQDNVFLQNVTKNKITDLKLTNDDGQFAAIRSSYGSGNIIARNKINDSYWGIYTEKGSANKIIQNKFRYATYGLYSQYETGDQITGNESQGLNISTYGFRSQFDYKSLYKNNTSNGGYVGFYLTSPQRVMVNHDTANDNGFAGFQVDGNAPGTGYNATILNSVANSNDEYGMFGAYPVPGKSNTALKNAYYNCYLVTCND
jgi:parallel beta-helix repeat protein